MENILSQLRGAALALAYSCAVIAMTFVPTFAQNFQLPAGSAYINMMLAQGGPPIGTGCTIGANSTDSAGFCTTTAASGTIQFSRQYSLVPSCIVVDTTATPVAVYAVTSNQITLTTVTSAHVLRWKCDALGFY